MRALLHAWVLLLATGCFRSSELEDDSPRPADMAMAMAPGPGPYPFARFRSGCFAGAVIELVTEVTRDFACDGTGELVLVEVPSTDLPTALPAVITIGGEDEEAAVARRCTRGRGSCDGAATAVSGELELVRLPGATSDVVVRYDILWGTGWRTMGEVTTGFSCSCL